MDESINENFLQEIYMRNFIQEQQRLRQQQQLQQHRQQQLLKQQQKLQAQQQQNEQQQRQQLNGLQQQQNHQQQQLRAAVQQQQSVEDVFFKSLPTSVAASFLAAEQQHQQQRERIEQARGNATKSNAGQQQQQQWHQRQQQLRQQTDGGVLEDATVGSKAQIGAADTTVRMLSEVRAQLAALQSAASFGYSIGATALTTVSKSSMNLANGYSIQSALNNNNCDSIGGKSNGNNSGMKSPDLASSIVPDALNSPFGADFLKEHEALLRQAAQRRLLLEQQQHQQQQFLQQQQQVSEALKYGSFGGNNTTTANKSPSTTTFGSIGLQLEWQRFQQRQHQHYQHLALLEDLIRQATAQQQQQLVQLHSFSPDDAAALSGVHQRQLQQLHALKEIRAHQQLLQCQLFEQMHAGQRIAVQIQVLQANMAVAQRISRLPDDEISTKPVQSYGQSQTSKPSPPKRKRTSATQKAATATAVSRGNENNVPITTTEVSDVSGVAGALKASSASSMTLTLANKDDCRICSPVGQRSTGGLKQSESTIPLSGASIMHPLMSLDEESGAIVSSAFCVPSRAGTNAEDSLFNEGPTIKAVLTRYHNMLNNATPLMSRSNYVAALKAEAPFGDELGMIEKTPWPSVFSPALLPLAAAQAVSGSGDNFAASMALLGEAVADAADKPLVSTSADAAPKMGIGAGFPPFWAAEFLDADGYKADPTTPNELNTIPSYLEMCNGMRVGSLENTFAADTKHNDSKSSSEDKGNDGSPKIEDTKRRRKSGAVDLGDAKHTKWDFQQKQQTPHLRALIEELATADSDDLARLTSVVVVRKTPTPDSGQPVADLLGSGKSVEDAEVLDVENVDSPAITASDLVTIGSGDSQPIASPTAEVLLALVPVVANFGLENENGEIFSADETSTGATAVTSSGPCATVNRNGDSSAARTQRKEYIDFNRKIRAIKHTAEKSWTALRCQACGAHIDVDETAIRVHVYSHSSVPLYACRECEHTFRQQHSVLEHVAECHPNKGRRGIEDRRDMKTLSASLLRCFGGGGHASAGGNGGAPRLVIFEMMEQLERVAAKVRIDKLRCQKCAQEIRAHRDDFTRHVGEHPFYKCNTCKYACEMQSDQIRHQQRKHAKKNEATSKAANEKKREAAIISEPDTQLVLTEKDVDLAEPGKLVIDENPVTKADESAMESKPNEELKLVPEPYSVWVTPEKMADMFNKCFFEHYYTKLVIAAVTKPVIDDTTAKAMPAPAGEELEATEDDDDEDGEREVDDPNPNNQDAGQKDHEKGEFCADIR